MTTVLVKGILTADGTIQVDLPDGWQQGEVNIEIHVDSEWTDDEIDKLIQSSPKSASEIVTGGWEDLDIQDSEEWVNTSRQKRRGQRKW